MLKNNANTNFLIVITSTIIFLGILFVILSTLLFKNIKEEILLIDIKKNKQIVENINKNMTFWINEKINLLTIASTYDIINDSLNTKDIEKFMKNIADFDKSFDVLQILYEKDRNFYMYENSKLHFLDSNKLNDLRNPYIRPWFKQTKETLKPNIYVVKKHGRLFKTTINISVPIIHNNEFVGVLAGVIAIENLIKKFSNLAINENMHVFLLLNDNEIFFPQNQNTSEEIKSIIHKYATKEKESDYFFISNLQFDIGKIGFFINNIDTLKYLNKLFKQEVILLLFFAIMLIVASLLYKFYYIYINKGLLNTKQLTNIYLNKNEYGLILLDKNHKITFINKIAKNFLYTLGIKDIFTFLKENSETIKHNSKTWIINKFPLYQYKTFQGGIVSIEDITEKENIKKQQQKNEYIFMHQAKMIEMGELVGGINHQLKQPLNSISILIGNILDFKKNNILTDELLIQNLSYCMDRISMLDNIINLYNDYYNNSINIKYFNLYKCIESVANMMNAAKKPNKNQRVNISIIGNKTLMLNSLENIISQIMLILISNANDAIKESDNKNIIINFMEHNNKITISVTDYGKGINEDLREGLFEEIKTTKINGVGIGLYFAKKLAKQKLQGDLYVSSYINPTKFILEIEKDLNDFSQKIHKTVKI